MSLAKPLNKYIDYTLLAPNASHDKFESFLDDAVKYQFASVCVPPYMAAPIKAALVGEDIAVGTVVGFPHGNLPLELKLKEIEYHGRSGIDEVDVVINYADLIAGKYDLVGIEVENIDRIAREFGLVSKCIVETCYLSWDELTFMYRILSERTEIDYIKTSTGFGILGAELVDVLNWNARRAEEEVPVVEDALDNSSGLFILPPTDTLPVRKEPLKIKAAGGIKDLETTLRFISAGADRIGTSNGVKVMEEFNASSSETFTEREGTTA